MRRVESLPRPFEDLLCGDLSCDLFCETMSRLDHLGFLLASPHIGAMSDEQKKLILQRKAAQEKALQEAAARRAAHVVQKRASESGGQDGPEPTRYGDWEKDGIISDF